MSKRAPRAKYEIERSCRERLATGDYPDEAARKRMENYLKVRKTNTMSAALRKRYERLKELWENRISVARGPIYIAGPPLPFEVSIEDPGIGDGADLSMYESWIDENRFYAVTIANPHRAYFLAAIYMGVGAFVASVVSLLWLIGPNPVYSYMLWPVVMGLGGGAVFFHRKHRLVTRSANNIFERKTGKFYRYQSQSPHAVHDFHDLYACIGLVKGGYGANAALMLFDVDEETGEHGLPLGRFTFETRSDALVFWCTLVRWMDPDWPLEETWHEYFGHLEEERDRYRFPVEGVRFEDGTAEWLIPGEKALRLGPWHEKLPKRKRARDKVFAQMKPLESAA